MKKVLAGMFTAMAAVVLCICMAACTTTFTGTWKLSSMTVSAGGVEQTIDAGKEYNGQTISKDAVVLEIKEDNTFTLGGAMSELMGGEQTGTWEEKEGKYYLTVEGEAMEVKLDGSKLVMESNESGISVKVTFKK